MIDRDIWVLGKLDLGLWFRGKWEQADSTRRTLSFGKSRLKIPGVKRMYSEVTSSWTKNFHYFQPTTDFLGKFDHQFPNPTFGPWLVSRYLLAASQVPPPMGPWGKGEGLWRWVCDRQQWDLLHQWWRTSGSHQNNLSIYKLMDGKSLKANHYLSVPMLFVFLMWTFTNGLM